jgi:hypothetical protein
LLSGISPYKINKLPILCDPFLWVSDIADVHGFLLIFEAWNFYSKALKQYDAKLFVMCRVGICRSASLAYFLLRGSGTNSRQAEEIVVRARPAASICKAYKETADAWLTGQKMNGKRPLMLSR